MKITFLLLILMSTFSLLAGEHVKNPNKFNEFGKREGYWYLDAHNNPVKSTDNDRISEGKYVNGRKEGVWIYYYEKTDSPRLVGEYSDNRPSGTYFRFNKQGKLFIASANKHSLRRSNRIFSSNPVYSCELNFEDQEIVAGQVFFSSSMFKENAYKFWVTKSFESSSSKSKIIDFSWLHNCYNSVYASYLNARKALKIAKPNFTEEKNRKTEKKKQQSEQPKRTGFSSPPVVKDPLVAEGLEFKPNGWNKLFTKTEDIWMDGFFTNGQLIDGKVFVYDRDGVLLKVRVYKKGEYISDGGL